jgi:hypothetical protein
MAGRQVKITLAEEVYQRLVLNAGTVPFSQYLSALIVSAGTDRNQVPSAPQVPMGTQSALNGVPTSTGTGTNTWVLAELELIKARLFRLEQRQATTVKVESKPLVAPAGEAVFFEAIIKQEEFEPLGESVPNNGIVKQEQSESEQAPKPERIHINLDPPEGIELPHLCPGWGNPDYELEDDEGHYVCIGLCDHSLTCKRVREKVLNLNKSATTARSLPVEMNISTETVMESKRNILDILDEKWFAFLKDKGLNITEIVMPFKDLPSHKWASYLGKEFGVPFELLTPALKWCSREARSQGFIS